MFKFFVSFFAISLLAGFASADGTVIDAGESAQRPGAQTQSVWESETVRTGRLTPQVGMTISTLVGNDTEAINSKSDLGAGLGLEFGRQSTVFETGLLYRQLGFKASVDVLGMSLGLDANLSYLSIPLLVKYYFNNEAPTSFYIKGGLLPSFIVSKKAKVTLGGRSAEGEINNLNTFDVGPTVGAGVRMSTGPNSDFIIEGNYYRGLTNVFTTGDSPVYNSAFSIIGGVGISI